MDSAPAASATAQAMPKSGDAEDDERSSRLGENARRGLPGCGRFASRVECRQGEQERDHHDVLNDQDADRDTPVKGIDLALVRQQLDDDDGAREGQRGTDVEGGHGPHPEAAGSQVAEDRDEGHLAQAGRDRQGAESANEPKIELQADDEQEQRDTDLGQQIDLIRGGHPAESGGPLEDAHEDEGDDQRLAQPERQRAEQRRGQQDGRNLSKSAFEHASSARDSPDQAALGSESHLAQYGCATLSPSWTRFS